DAVATYKETRNGLIGVDYSTKFSPWLALGCISPRYIYHQIKTYERERTANQSTYWVIFELLWRDYFKFVGIKYGNKMFQVKGLQGKSVPWKVDMKLFDAWKEGRTGVPFVDANMRELALTGFMSNRGRQNVASFLTKDLGLDWRQGAEWFEYLLIDHDVCSNYGNWLYSAGIGNDPRENRKFNMIKQALDYDINGEYVRRWVPELGGIRGADVHTPWNLSSAALSHAGVSLGDTYPTPVVTAPEWSRHFSKKPVAPFIESLQQLNTCEKCLLLFSSRHRACYSQENMPYGCFLLQDCSMKKLGLYLNPKHTVAADWTAVAETMGFSYLEIKNYETFRNPTKIVLDDWAARNSDASVGKLLSILEEVERKDIVEDLQPLIGAQLIQRFIISAYW
ncbi:hypothetical protein XENOCAPTIV_007583, partial [Xenoophorus captivus]